MTAPAPPEHLEQVCRRLHIVRAVAILDLILLAALISSSLTGNREFVRVLGPFHGGNFLLLLIIVGTAAADGLWGWWFPAGVLLTGGPLGALVGERLVGRRLAAARAMGEREGSS